jgi:hypothetical protein
MKNIALVAALVSLLTTASVRVAAACGASRPPAATIGVSFADRWAAYPGATATGVWPRLEREGARTILSLSYPVFGADAEPRLYMHRFEIVHDRNLRRLERALARRAHPDLDVNIERVDGFRWRVTGWSVRA